MDPKLTAILSDYELALEDLTFNSKPLINNLTMAADKYKPIASKIIEKIERRLFQVRPEHKLPLLYLLDSIMKNLKGEYLTVISKNVVAVFCHVFEKLTDPKSRLALWKLRNTWSAHIPNRKLAAIDRHVNALDSNWPVTAVDSDPPSPTIFVNPKFLESESQQSAKKEGLSSKVEKKIPKGNEKPASVNANSSETAPKSPPAIVTTEPPPAEGEGSEGLSLQDRRKQLLEQQKQKKLEQQIAMGLMSSTSTANVSESVVQDPRQRLTTRPATGSGRRSASPKVFERRSASPIPVPSSRSSSKKTSPRNRSPVTVIDGGSNHVGGVELGSKHELKLSDLPLSREETPPLEKRPRMDGSESVTEEKNQRTPPKPIKQSTLELDDLPAELLPKHQEYVLKQIEKQLQSGSLTEKERDVLVEQLDKLYELQRQKEAQKKGSKKSSEAQETQTDSKSAVHSNQTSLHSSGPDTGGQLPVHSRSGRGRPQSSFDTSDSGVHSHGPPPPLPPHPGPLHDRFRRGGPRPHYRPRGPRRPGPRFYPRPPRRHPPPPHWEPMEMDHGPIPPGPTPHQSQLPHPPQPQYPSQPPHPEQPPQRPQPQPLMQPNKLFEKLLEAGLVKDESGGDEEKRQEPQPRKQPEASSEFDLGPSEKPPLNIPNLSFTPATLKQRYTSLLSLLHAGEPCASCGLRFISRAGEEYRNHLDWHFRVNRKEREGSKKSSRNWFMHPEDWLKYEESSGMEEKEPPTIVPEMESPEQGQAQEEEASSCKVLPGEGNEECTICQEPFEQFWEEDLEEWHFKDAMRSDDGKLYHKFCYEDAKASGVLDTSGSQQPSPVVELKPVTGVS